MCRSLAPRTGSSCTELGEPIAPYGWQRGRPARPRRVTELFSFNDLLISGGVDPAKARLLRHKVGDLPVLDLWREDRALIEGYQSRQNAGAFDGATHVVSLLPRPEGNEVFIGAYEVLGSTLAPSDDVCPLSKTTHDPIAKKPRVFYELRRVLAFAEYEDRLVVEWYPAGKAPGWNQWAHRNPKRIVEIATQRESPFPGWLEFLCPVDDLDLLPRGWREVLRSTSGVYLLTDALGKHYVGSAKGGDGFLGRWRAYRDGRSGGNVGLVGAIGPFTVAVLQTFDPSTPDQTVERIESIWKSKLGAREAGYNRN